MRFIKILKTNGYTQIIIIESYFYLAKIMSHLSVKNLAICVTYGSISILQTLNSRYLYRGIGFDFYSFIFGVQRLFIIAFFYLFTDIRLKKSMLTKILPYSFFMCLINILSSYCITIMPLAAFLAFKKFTVVFILVLSITLQLPNRTNSFQNFCIIGIIIGGCMVGQKDMLHGNLRGYLSCLLFNMSQSIALQYSNYLYREERLEPQQLLFYNCTISFPYYLGVMTYEAEFGDVFDFFMNSSTLIFFVCLMLSVVFACLSELSSSYIAMKISPFQKSMVSNIKDLILMIISIQYFADLKITIISGVGIILCMASSILFSLPYLQQKQSVKKALKQPVHLQQEHSDLLNEDINIKHSEVNEKHENKIQNTNHNINMINQQSLDKIIVDLSEQGQNSST